MSRFTNSIAQGMSRLWQTYSLHRQSVAQAKERGRQSKTTDKEEAKVVEAQAFHLADIESEALTADDRIKSAFSAVVGLVAPFILALILSLSNGYFFAGFHDPSWTLQSMVAYAGGMVLELIGLAAIFKAQQALKEGTRGFFLSAFLFAIALSAISLVAQYLYLQIQDLRGLLTVPDSAIARIPIVSWVVGINGMQGHDWLFLIRGGAFHLAEIGCTFLISKRHKSLRRLIAQQREIQDARLMWERNELLQDMERGIATQLQTMMRYQSQITQAQFARQLNSLTHSTPQLPEAEEKDTSPLALSPQALNNGRKGK